LEFKVEIDGLNRLAARLAGAAGVLDSKMAEGLKEVASCVVRDARSLVPVDTGSLQRSIRMHSYVMEGHVQEVVVTAGGYVTNPKTGRKVDYAAYVEYGTSRVKPKPFLNPALERNRWLLLEVLRGRLRESMG